MTSTGHRMLIFVLMVLPLAQIPGAGFAADNVPAERPAVHGNEPTQVEQRTLRAIRWLDRQLDRIPRYELPEVDDDGNITVRRIRPQPDPAPADSAPDPGADIGECDRPADIKNLSDF